MSKANAVGDAPKRQHLETEEIASAFDALSPDDKLKLSAIEAHLLGGSGLGKGDLLHETVCRALTGQRKCPRNVPFMAFVVETMKSIASHAREKHGRTVVLADPAESGGANANDSDPAANPEDALVASSVVEKIYSHFEDDEEATLVLMGWAEGLRGRQLREVTGLDQAKLDYAIKRIRKRMRTLYPEGWTR